jgi:hypothetical protein
VKSPLLAVAAVVIGLVGLAGCGPAKVPATAPRTVVIPPTTRIADEATRAALTQYDRSSGILRFAGDTSFLDTLKPGEVIVSAPSQAAPYGYLRKIVSVRKADIGTELVLQTVQANLTEAVSQGELDAHVQLAPSDLERTELALEGVTMTPLDPSNASPGDAAFDAVDDLALGVGDNYGFELQFHRVFVPKTGENVRGQVTLDGFVRFQAGYSVTLGLSGCLTPPFVCVDSFKTLVGFDQSADLKITGDASGDLGEKIRISTHYFSPQVFFIGPFPVVLVPRLDLDLSMGGRVEARVTFEASEGVVAQVGAGWTDDEGWKDLSRFDVAGEVMPPTFTGSIRPRAGLRSAMSFKLYDLAGPEASLDAGLELDGEIPRNPLWIANAYFTGDLGFVVELPVIGTLAEHRMRLFDLRTELARAGNVTPTLDLSAKTRPDPNVFPPGSPPTVPVRALVDFTPGCAGSLGGGAFFTVADAEDVCPTTTLVSDRDGPLPFKHTFQTPGRRVLTVTARDSQGASVQKVFTLDVANYPPVLTLLPPGIVRQGEPLPIAARITDANEKDPYRLCANNVWSVEAPDALRGAGGCLETITFGATGVREVRVKARDSDGAVAFESLIVNVLPPAANPNPILNGATLKFSELSQRGVDVCPSGGVCCVERTLGNDAVIDLTKAECSIPASTERFPPAAHVLEADVVNPTGEALTYQWQLYLGESDLPVYGGYGGDGPRFRLHDVGDLGALMTSRCRVTLKVEPADLSRSKGPIQVWVGTCTLHGPQVR